MRLFWKLFCSMVMIAALVCALSGFVLIDGQFRAGMGARAELAMTENTLLRRTLLRELQFSGGLDRDAAVNLTEQSFPRPSGGGSPFASLTARGAPWRAADCL